MNHFYHIESLTTPHVISSTSFTVSYLLTLGILGITKE
jgi:hypothetical protein